MVDHCFDLDTNKIENVECIQKSISVLSSTADLIWACVLGLGG